MKVKTVFNGDIRSHAFNAEDDINVLSGVICKAYNIEKPFSLTYEDSDGDVVTIKTDADLKLAIEDTRKVLKIRVDKDVKPKKQSVQQQGKPKVEICDENAPPSDDDEIEEEDEEVVEPEHEKPNETSGETENVYEVYCDDLLENDELQKEISAAIKMALARVRAGDNIQVAVETALAHHEMVGNHPLVQKFLPKLPFFAQKAALWVPVISNIQDAQVDFFFQMILAKLRALRETNTEYPDFSFLQRHPLLGHIFSQLDVYTEPGENSNENDIHIVAQQKEIVHQNVACDICNAEPITGVRYKCSICPDYDLCEKCENENKHDPTHPLIKMNVALQNTLGRPHGTREFMRQAGGRRRGCGRGRGRGGHRGRCGGRGFPKWLKHIHEHLEAAHNENENESNDTPLNPEAKPFNPFAGFPFGRWRGGRGRGGKCGGRGRGRHGHCHGKKHWRHEKKNRGPLEYDAKLVKHMNLEDDTPVGQGILVKTWRVQNCGLKSWNNGDVAVVYEGKPFHELVDGARFDIAGPVECGQEVDVSVVLNVPEGFSGDALVKYRLKCGDIKFGPPLKVKIRVVGDEITEIQKVRRPGKNKTGKVEKKLEKLEKQKNKLEQKAEMMAAKIEKLQAEKQKQKQEEEAQQTQPILEPVPVEEEEETKEPVIDIEEENSSSSFEVVNEEDEEDDAPKGYSFEDFNVGWSKRHLRQTSMESIKRAFLRLQPDQDGLVSSDVAEKFYEEFGKLEEDKEKKEENVEVHEDSPVLVEEEQQPAKPDEPKPKEEKPFEEPKPFPYQDQVEQLTAMGLNEDLVRGMLESKNGDVQAVLNEIFS